VKAAVRAHGPKTKDTDTPNISASSPSKYLIVDFAWCKIALTHFLSAPSVDLGGNRLYCFQRMTVSVMNWILTWYNAVSNGDFGEDTRLRLPMKILTLRAAVVQRRAISTPLC
jgi:hypothetical protein